MTENTTTRSGGGVVSATRRIGAPVDQVFVVLADPARHPGIDGSGMLRDGTGNRPVSALGDAFTVTMHNDEMGDYVMINRVVAYEPNRRIVWEPALQDASRDEDRADIGQPAGHRWGYELEPDGPEATVVTEIFDCSQAAEWLRTVTDDGNTWLPAMVATLERLDGQCRGPDQR